uniref:Tumor protein D52 n=1 Tax=Rousettus aegyptiacus TaxID=9407 RepID=A0A7J8C4U4_ROUAE|nr:tumor protein D52 [Rousettus aegyptiacus]
MMGLLGTDPVPEAGEDAVAAIGATETLSEEEQEELRRELAKVEEEIQTLSQVLAAKEKRHLHRAPPRPDPREAVRCLPPASRPHTARRRERGPSTSRPHSSL